MSRRYQKISKLLPEIRKMITDGRTHREIEQEFGIEGKQPIHDLLKRERHKEKKLADGLSLSPRVDR